MEPTEATLANPGADRIADKPRQALVALADHQDRETIGRILVGCGLHPVLCSTSAEARAILASKTISLVFCQAALPDGGFLEVLRAADSSRRKVPIVVCSRLVDADLYLRAMEMGAYDFVVSPYQKADVAWIAEGALRKVAEPPRAVAAHAASRRSA
jgi:DNA-binding NtrC family response regulator